MLYHILIYSYIWLFSGVQLLITNRLVSKVAYTYYTHKRSNIKPDIVLRISCIEAKTIKWMDTKKEIRVNLVVVMETFHLLYLW